MLNGTYSRDVIARRNPEKAFEIDSSRTSARGIECVREVDPRNEFARVHDSGNQDVRQRRSPRRNRPKYFGDGPAGEASTKYRVQCR